jgi:endonuclease YncB( thermonuclease family)
VRTPAGKDVEFRLYFVDAPESRPKTYGHGENNFKRIADQGAYFGGLTQQQTVKIGAEAKQFIRSLLSQKKFQVTTSWEPVYNSARRYAFVTVSWQGKPRYLHEILVSKGYARIHTLGRPLPDGKTSYYQQKSHLKQLEQTAKRQRQGAWGIR